MSDGNKSATVKAIFDSLLGNEFWEAWKLYRNILAVTPFGEVVYEEVGQVASVVRSISCTK
jgi:hypothetical protein